MMLDNAFRVQCTSPNMECVAMLGEKTYTRGKIIKTKGMMLTVGDDVKQLGSDDHISGRVIF